MFPAYAVGVLAGGVITGLQHRSSRNRVGLVEARTRREVRLRLIWEGPPAPQGGCGVWPVVQHTPETDGSVETVLFRSLPAASSNTAA